MYQEPAQGFKNGFYCYGMNIPGKILIVILQFVLFPSVIQIRQPDYREVFGDNWSRAEEFIAGNEQWMIPLCEKYDIDFREAKAVVFPELVRYSALRDRMEITLLKALYINMGDEYADFSVGRFQMKPSFAEQIRDFILTPEGKRYRNLLGNNTPKKGSREYRASIISDMEDIRRQFGYLVIFIKACEKTHKQLPSEGAGRVSFIASAYNTGFRKSAEEIDLMTEKKFFTTHLSGPPYYSYSDISLFWYRKSEKK